MSEPTKASIIDACPLCAAEEPHNHHHAEEVFRVAHEAGIRIGEQRATAKIVSLLRVEGPIAGGVIWQTIARIARDIERGDHIEHTADRGGDGDK